MATPSFSYSKSLIIRPETQVPDSVVDQVFQYLATTDSGAVGWSVNFEVGGGQTATVPANATAFPHRDGIFVMLAYAATNGSVSATTTGFIDGLDTVIKSGNPSAYYGEYAGYVDAREQADQARYHYWGPNLQRLEQIKAAVDPSDVFHNQQSVLPSQK